MTSFNSLLCGTAALLLVVSSVENHVHALALRGGSDKHRELDTSGGLDLLEPEYQVGVTYTSNMVMDQTSKMDMGGQEMDSTFHMELGNEMSVSKLPEGGKKIDLLYTGAAISMTMMGQTVFDSNSPTEEANPALEPLEELVGHTVTIVLDDEDNVLETFESDEISKKLSSVTNNAMNDLGSSNNFEQMTRMTKGFPGQEVQPGDSWDIDLGSDEMFHYTGTGTLEGYKVHEGHRCAVVTMVGYFDMNFEALGDALEESNGSEGGALMNSFSQNLKVTEGKMNSTVSFDSEDKFARLIRVTETMTMQMTSPLDDEVIEIPVEQVVLVTTDIRE